MPFDVQANPSWDDLFRLHLPDSWTLEDKGMLYQGEHIVRTRHVMPDGKLQMRASNTPYYTHCISAAITLLWLNPQPTAVVAAMTHDLKEDCEGITNEYLAQTLSPEVAFLVDSLTRKVDQSLAEFVQQLGAATALNPAVVEIRLADTSHNAITLGSFSHDKKRKWCLKVLEGYLPYFVTCIDLLPVERQDKFRDLLAQTCATIGEQLDTLGIAHVQASPYELELAT